MAAEAEQTRSTECGPDALAQYSAPQQTTLAASCDLTQRRLPIVVARDIDVVRCSPDDVRTGTVCGSTIPGKAMHAVRLEVRGRSR